MRTSLLSCPPLSDQLTVEATIDVPRTLREGMQALVSQWRPRETFDGFSAFDASSIGGLNCTGYFGAVFDGRYVYFVPEKSPDMESTHAVVLRYDTHAPFDDEDSYAAYDAANTMGLDTRGYYGAAFDGRYVYFIPRQIDNAYHHSRLLRFDTRGEFHNEASWNVHDIGFEQSSQSCGFDGRYLYLCPGYTGDPNLQNEHCGKVLRYDTRDAFGASSSYRSFDLTKYFGPRAACYDGAVFDGRYMYFVPLENAVVARYDTTLPFENFAAWQTRDILPLGTRMFVGAVFDGRFVYFVAYNTGNIVRFEIGQNFQDADAWDTYDAEGTNGLRCGGYDGGYFDGRFIHYVPFVQFDDKQLSYHGHYLRFDASGDFKERSKWQARDISCTGGLKTLGYNAGAFDGRYFYSAPWHHGMGRSRETAGIHGNIFRHDTLGNDATFSLRACDLGHNGGLCASTPGPSFFVNTSEGRVLGVSAHRELPAGRHRINGVYNGQTIKLIINGQVVAKRAATGTIQTTDAPISVGCIEGGGGAFEGEIFDVRLSDRAEY